MSSRPELRLDWCSHEAAKYACEKWHYSRCMPSTMQKPVKVGVWERLKFIGVVVFSHGANKEIGTAYGLTVLEACELTRVALHQHEAAVSRIVSIAIKKLKQQCPGIRLIVSYADSDQQHVGTIYQAGNWVYIGESKGALAIKYRGKIWHPKAFDTSFPGMRQAKGATKVQTGGKHKYLMPLDEDMRRKIEPLRKPYPKRAGSAGSGTPPIQGGRGGATPTSALLSQEESDGQARTATGADHHQDGEGQPRQKTAQQKRAKAAKR